MVSVLVRGPEGRVDEALLEIRADEEMELELETYEEEVIQAEVDEEVLVDRGAE
jgi:hypothetical protein